MLHQVLQGSLRHPIGEAAQVRADGEVALLGLPAGAGVAVNGDVQRELVGAARIAQRLVGVAACGKVVKFAARGGRERRACRIF